MPPKNNPKKGGKGREKKLKRKQGQAEVEVAWTKVKQAYEMGDFMDMLIPFKKFERNGLSVDISFTTMDRLSKDTVKWCYSLLKDNMKAQYISAGWGWKDNEKMDELTHDSSCFLLAKDTTTSEYLGFVSFRFDIDNGSEVLYCYEVQLKSEARRKGLGKFLMQILELICHKASMMKIVLTVFKENQSSNSFFRDKLGYIHDDSSPSVYDPLNPEDYSYFILSKSTIKSSQKSSSLSHSHDHGCDCSHGDSAATPRYRT